MDEAPRDEQTERLPTDCEPPNLGVGATRGDDCVDEVDEPISLTSSPSNSENIVSSRLTACGSPFDRIGRRCDVGWFKDWVRVVVSARRRLPAWATFVT